MAVEEEEKGEEEGEGERKETRVGKRGGGMWEEEMDGRRSGSRSRYKRKMIDMLSIHA